MGARPEDIALTDSTTMGLGLLYGALDLDDGQEILTTEHDFYSTHESLRLRAERTGASVRKARLYDDPESSSVGEIVERIQQAIGPRTRVLAVTWVHSSTGVKLPIAEIAAAVEDANRGRDSSDRILLSVDGVHGLGVEDGAVSGDLKEGLIEMPHVTLRTPLDEELSAGIVCFEIEGVQPEEAVDRLLNEDGVVASVTPYSRRYVRLGPSIVTSREDVAEALRAVGRGPPKRRAAGVY